MAEKRRIYHSTTVSADVEIEIADIIGEIPTATLIEELRRRKQAADLIDSDANAVDAALYHYRSGNLGECLRYVERILPQPFRGIADKFFPVH